MLILQSTSADPSRGLGAAFGNIQELAEQVICYSEDMEYTPNRADLMRLPATLLPSPCLSLGTLLYNNKDMQDILCTLADQKGLVIEFYRNYLRPQVIWLQGGAILSQEDRISSLIILPRPKSRDVDPVATDSAQVQEPLSRGLIERPIAEGQFVQSSFQCRVGDIIILEGGERLQVHTEANVEPRGVCFLTILFQVQRNHHLIRNFDK
ncbi:hypothetical protein V8C42DRAFT_336647 [Trichoderma barbatum]